MEQKTTDQTFTSAVANPAETNAPAATRKDFVEPDISEPVDILAATKFFLQVTSGGDI
jgi:hypothetical protein